MRKLLLSGALAVFGLSAVAGGAHAAKAIKWSPTFRAAMTAAKTGNKLVMVDFYTEWWGWCKRLDKETYTDDRVIQASEQLVPVKLDAEKEGKTVAQKYGVTGYPTILFLNTEGEVEGKIGGYMPPDGFAPEMQKYISLHSEFPKVEAKYKAGDRSVPTLSTLSWAYAGRGNSAKAEELLGQAEKASTGTVTSALAKAYNAVGDSYQEKQQFAKAIGFFTKAEKSTDADAVTYARISVAVCYLSQNKLDQGASELKALIAMPNATPTYKKQAEEMLKQVEALQKKKQ